GDRPLQPDHAQQLPEMPAALLVQPPPRVGRGAALGGHGARRLSARGAAGLPRAGGGMAPARSGTAAAVAWSSPAATPRRIPLAHGGRARPKARVNAG